MRDQKLLDETEFELVDMDEAELLVSGQAGWLSQVSLSSAGWLSQVSLSSVSQLTAALCTAEDPYS